MSTSACSCNVKVPPHTHTHTAQRSPAGRLHKALVSCGVEHLAFSVYQHFGEDEIFVWFLKKRSLMYHPTPCHLSIRDASSGGQWEKRPQVSSKGSTAIRPPPPTVRCVSQLGHSDRKTYAGPITRNAPCSHAAIASPIPRPSPSPPLHPAHSSSQRQHTPNAPLGWTRMNPCYVLADL